MVNQYSSEDNQAIETPSPPSAVSLAGDSRESMVDQCYPEGSQSSVTRGPTSAVSPAGDGEAPIVAQCMGIFERVPSLTST